MELYLRSQLLLEEIDNGVLARTVLFNSQFHVPQRLDIPYKRGEEIRKWRFLNVALS